MTLMRSTILAIIVSIVLIFGAVYYSSRNDGGAGGVAADNVRVENGIQIVELSAKGGYTPRKSAAKAGMPTILRMNTKGTFDCSIAVRIPSMRIAKNLQPNGSADIDLGTPGAGIVYGTCAMGMYPFEINFTS